MNSTDDNIVRKKIFIPTIGTWGDVKPFLTLAKHLKARGHSVHFGTHERYQDAVRAQGIDCIEIGGDMDVVLSSTPEGIELRRNPSIFRINLLKQVYASMFEHWFNAIIKHAEDMDLIVFSIGSLLAGLSCIEKFPKLRAVVIYTFPFLKTSEFAPPGLGGSSRSLFKWINLIKWKMFNYAVFNMHTETVNRNRRNVNLPPIVLDYNRLVEHLFQKPLSSATIYSKFLIDQPLDWSTHDDLVGPIFDDSDDPFEVPTGLNEFLNHVDDRRLVYIGMGSMISVIFTTEEQLQFLNQMRFTITQQHCRAILSLVGFDESLINKVIVSDDVFYLKKNLSHDWLFPKMNAVIHHGGAGTTHTGLKYGLPTLTLPFGADQPFNGDRIFIRQLGPSPISIRQVNSRKLNNAFHDLLTANFNTYSTNARKIADLMKNEDGLTKCINLVETELSI